MNMLTSNDCVFNVEWLNYFDAINVDIAKQLNIALQLESLSSNRIEYFTKIATIIVCWIECFTKTNYCKTVDCCSIIKQR